MKLKIGDYVKYKPSNIVFGKVVNIKTEGKRVYIYTDCMPILHRDAKTLKKATDEEAMLWKLEN